LKDRRWDTKKVLSSAGMPSPHAATVMGLAAAVGLKEGSESSAFAIAVVFACVVSFHLSRA
jgi:acid phosphatase family membrane protein YuiD